MSQRKTQSERRAESRQAVLDSACRLFGEQGYRQTSLEQIAADCGLTIRPIYHYFKNKEGLFASVNDVMEARIVEAMNQSFNKDGFDLMMNWRAFLDLCEDRHFRQVVLIDSPDVLGRGRWATSPVTTSVLRQFQGNTTGDALAGQRAKLLSRVMMATLAEIALVVAESDDVGAMRGLAEEVVDELVGPLVSYFG